MTTLIDRIIWRLLVTFGVLTLGGLAVWGGELAKAWLLAAGSQP